MPSPTGPDDPAANSAATGATLPSPVIAVLGVLARAFALVVDAVARLVVPRHPPTPPPAEVPVPTLGPTVQVVPGPGMPAGMRVTNANNNLDVVEHDGRRYLAVRTAPFHFASPDARIEVVSCDDDGTTAADLASTRWRHETTVALGRDVREPRLLSLDGSLFCYFFEAGTHPLRFEPGRILVTRRNPDGTWDAPVPVSGDGYVVWRTKHVDGVPYMVRYRGGSEVYEFRRRDLADSGIDVEFCTTDDGVDWRPVDPDRPVAHRGGASETDVTRLPDGRFVAVMRNELGDARGWGSTIAVSAPDRPGDWTLVRNDPRKFDSPLVFAHDGRVWLVARRQTAGRGRYDLGWRRLSTRVQQLVYEVAYSLSPKRSALWTVDPDTAEVHWVADLPSRGDTSFAGLLRADDDTYVVFDYSSPVDGPDVPWLAGQIGPTHVYATTLRFPA